MAYKKLMVLALICLFHLLTLNTVSAQKYGGVLKIAHWGNPPSMSIHEVNSVSTFLPAMSVFNNLVLFDQAIPVESLGTIKPELASSWKWSDGGRKLIFQLRKGVKWHDGKPFTSRDVKYTWDLLMGKSIQKLRKNPRKSWYRNLRRVTTNGDLEVTFHLARPQPSFLALIAGGAGAVYPAHVSPEKIRTHPVGTGPFKFVEYRKNDKVVLTKNPAYWIKGRPYLDGWEMLIIPDLKISTAALISGKVDASPVAVSAALADKIRSENTKIVIEERAANVSVYLDFNHKAPPPFDNRMLRRALALAINRQPYAEHYIGGAMPAKGVWSLSKAQLAGLPGYGNLNQRQKSARAIMRRLGYGPDNRLKFNLVTQKIVSRRRFAAEIIEGLKKIYVEAELGSYSGGKYRTKIRGGDFIASISLKGIKVDDPDAVFFSLYSCGGSNNAPQFCDPELDRMIEHQSSQQDPSKRLKLVHEIDLRLQRNFARPVIIHLMRYRAKHPYVKGLQFHHGLYNSWRFQDVWLDK